MRVLALLLVVFLPTVVTAVAAPPPNVVLIISDDQGWKDYGFMGHAQIKTPHLDKLSKESLVFKRGYVSSSLCCPSLASVITGRHPHEHKICFNDPPSATGDKVPGGAVKSPDFLENRRVMASFMEQSATLPRVLGAQGYRSFQAGKWWLNSFHTGGFTDGMTQGEAKKGGRHGDDGLDIGRKTMEPVFDFVRSSAKEAKPFFLWYAPMMPHQPHNPPARLLDKYKAVAPTLEVAKYWASVEWFDESCGQLLDFLDAQGLRENTIVAYFTDNGWIQDPDKDKYAAKSKQSPYDGGLRTPIMIRWPGHVEAKESPRLATALDLFPTLCTATGAKAPAGLPGINLLDPAALEGRNTLYGECFTHNAVDMQDPATSLRWRWMIDGDWKVILPAPQNEPDGKPELYQLSKDADEEHDLAAENADRVAEMRKKVDAWYPGEVRKKEVK